MTYAADLGGYRRQVAVTIAAGAAYLDEPMPRRDILYHYAGGRRREFTPGAEPAKTENHEV